jgi:hypothetical protein
MHFADVVVKKNALDRSVGYAQKINELYMYDCGLGDWIVETRYKGESYIGPHAYMRLQHD